MNADSNTPRNSRQEQVARWLMFSVLVALLPIFANALTHVTSLVLSEQAGTPSATRSMTLLRFLGLVCGNGDLLLISAALSATTVGDLVATRSNSHGVARIVISGGAVLLVAISSLWYPMIVRLEGSLNMSHVAIGSIVVWFSSVVTGASGILLSTLDEG